jgi:hypothetical protein
MKNSILTLSSFLLVFGALFTGCTDSAQNVQDAQEDVIEAEAELAKAQMEYQMDVENHKVQTASTIRSNNERIAEFNASLANEKKELRDEYNVKIAELERRNNAMERKMADYNTSEYRSDSKTQWENFKSEFKRDMDQLEQELSDLTSNRNN